LNKAFPTDVVSSWKQAYINLGQLEELVAAWFVEIRVETADLEEVTPFAPSRAASYTVIGDA
jgi:hypothetical protein